MKLALVCSSGGHLYELYSLQSAWRGHERFWVTFEAEDSCYLLKGERVYWAYQPTNRSVLNLFRNLWLAVRILSKEKPHVVLSTGAGVGVPFLYIAKLLGCKTIYIESIARVKELSLSGKLVLPIADMFYVQWPELTQKYPKTQYHGSIV
jgi:beta-1,4-N-acetylglucosaminyltransferase